MLALVDESFGDRMGFSDAEKIWFPKINYCASLLASRIC